ncbi:MAG: electron transport complex subunit RsxG [Zoogloeaceae bacterium]|jgi:electron transport complex protein RnfG|nr:electron transport complex subunit RsxG [Zoogloeaceae bacterium]
MSDTAASSATASALRTSLILAAFVLVFTGLLSVVYQWTRPRIEASLAAERLQIINEVLPARHYDNDLLADTLTLPPTPELGQKSASVVYRARRQGRPAALVLEAIAPDGYAGEIRLILAIGHDGVITGVRVVEHKETPGLGDYIDPKKDKDKKYPWILQFNGLDYPRTPAADWKVRKDKGIFYYRVGATITPRAVIAAVGRAARFATEHREELFAETTP